MENIVRKSKAREARQRRKNMINQRTATRCEQQSQTINQHVNARQDRENTNPVRAHNVIRAVRSNPRIHSGDNIASTSNPITETVLNFGEPKYVCAHCGALFWYEERKQNQRPTSDPQFPLCCQYGQVTAPLLQAPPPLLEKLLDPSGRPESRQFRDKIRMYNTVFAFTSMGGKIDNTVNNGTAPYAFRLSGQNYHLMGSLVPPIGKPPKFIQLYIYDTENELQNRMSVLNDTQSSTTPTLNEDLVHELLKMLDENNGLVKVLRMARERFKEDELVPIQLKIHGKRNRATREYNLPTSSEIAALIVGDIEDTIGHRDIVIDYRSGGLQQINEYNPKFMAMQYPLLFPYGEDGYIQENEYSEDSRRPNKKRKCNTICEYYAFRVQQRREEKSALLRGGRLYQQYLVDAYTCIEAERLQFIRFNQNLLRTELYDGLADAIAKGDNDATLVGRRFILPSSFTGGPRYKMQNYQDAMAICRVYGNPDLFITFTANTKWAEVQSMLKEIPDQKIEDRPDIIVRVFKMKLDALMRDLRIGRRFGRVNAALYTIEFQKRGLPHAHILLFLHPDDKCKTAEDIDNIISAEIPDEKVNPEGYAAVKQFMIHGPCGRANSKALCMDNGECTKHYPKRFYSESTLDDGGFPIYRRRDDGRRIIKKGIQFDNRDVVPHNINLIVRYQAHINVEWCNKSRSIKYLFKYINKGPDRGSFILEQTRDEIEEYLNCRYISACEAVWRIFQFDMNYRTPSVQRLSFHLPNKQPITYRDGQRVSRILSREGIQSTMFTQWLEANKTYEQGRELTYTEFPEKFVWHDQEKEWRPRKQGNTIGRVVYAHPTSGEHFFLRMLLNIVKGPTSYEEIRTYNGITHSTFKEACHARGLLDGDKEWSDAIQEASQWANPAQLRQLFVTMMLFCNVCDPLELWTNNWKNMSDDVLYKQRSQLRYQELQLTDDQIKNYALFEIEKILLKSRRSLKDFPPMPLPDSTLLQTINNTLIRDELRINREDLIREHEQLHAGLNPDQKIIYDNVTEAARTDKGGMFFIYGHGGTGKTYLYKTIISKIRSEGEIVLALASSGIAALLLPLGRTAHSRMDIPIELTPTSTCNIAQGSPLAELIKKAKLIVWDEAPMTHRHAFEAVDRTLRDILQFTHDDATNTVFGGKTVLLGGDFRQILPVVNKGRREDIVRASISKSKLWQHCQIFSLTQNMRLTQAHGSERENVQQFARWILSLGDGKLPTIRADGQEEPTWIEIPPDLLIDPKENSLNEIVNTAYPEILERYNDPTYLRDRCILAPRNETVDEINYHIMENLPGETKIYRSSDSICKSSGEINDEDILYPIEFLNSLKFNGMPDNELKLKVGTPIILLRNINQTEGLCNGTRLIITHLAEWVIEAEIMTGINIGAKAFIPRIVMSPTESKWPFLFNRRQFPVKACYAMTINKSQGQTLNHVALYLPQPVFSHGQLYVAVSRVTSRKGLKILIDNRGHMPQNYTKNIVYKEIFEDIPTE